MSDVVDEVPTEEVQDQGEEQKAPEIRSSKEDFINRVQKKLDGESKPKPEEKPPVEPPKGEHEGKDQKMVPISAMHALRNEKKELFEKARQLEAEIEKLKSGKEVEEFKVDDSELDKVFEEYKDDPLVRLARAQQAQIKKLEQSLNNLGGSVQRFEQRDGEQFLNEQFVSLQKDFPELGIWKDGLESEAIEDFLGFVNETRMYTPEKFRKAFMGHFANEILEAKKSSVSEEIRRDLKAGRDAGRMIGKPGRAPSPNGKRTAANSKAEFIKRVEERLAARGQI